MNIDLVVIGINSQATLRECLDSLAQVDYPEGTVSIYYVDGGSTDDSLCIAKQFSNVTVIELQATHPTPGKGRNAGWKAGHSPLVQFLDSDTCLDPTWLSKASKYLIEDEQLGAIYGLLKERYPERSVYNWLGDQEWNPSPGIVNCFGGNILIKRDLLESTFGYNEELVAGEDPELSLRVRLLGKKIVHIAIPMSSHDLGMYSWKQYVKRCYRSGYAYAAVNALHKKANFWNREMIRIVIRGGGICFFLLAALIFYWAWALVALFLFLFPFTKINRFRKTKNLSYKESCIYALHCCFVVLPQFFGVVRYYGGALFNKPLHNKRKN